MLASSKTIIMHFKLKWNKIIKKELFEFEKKTYFEEETIDI